MKNQIRLLVFLTLFTNYLFAQQSDSSWLDSVSKTILPKNTELNQPVIYNEKNNSLPDKVEVRGIITEISKGYCGYICLGGTIEVKVSSKIKNYPYDNIYIVTACMIDIKIGTEINVVATKLLQSDKNICYYKTISNIIDSNGLPFYKLTEYETNKINNCCQ